MTSLQRWSCATVLAAVGLVAPVRAEPPSPSPPPPSPRPISASVDRVVDRLEAQKAEPCREAQQKGIPCFPVATTIKGDAVSVRESLGVLGPPRQASPGRPPTLDEIKPYRPGVPTSSVIPVIPIASFDPGCVGRSVLKSLKGKNDVYYLYRLREVHGVRVALYDRRLDASTFQGEVALLGRFEGECAARAAYQRELLKQVQ